MAFCFKKRECVKKAVRRLGCERIKKGLDCLERSDVPEAIHCARKEIKRSRAVLRLVYGQIRRKDFRVITESLREAAGCLAGPRDAYVKVKALNDLRVHFKDQLTRQALPHIRSYLEMIRDDEMKRFEKERVIKRIPRILRRASQRMADLTVKGDGWSSLCDGVNTAYAEGKCAHQTVLKDCSPENLHRWRKRAKDLWYQMNLLRPLWPELMDAKAQALERLSDYLGDHHDLTVLCEESAKVDSATREFETLKALIDQRQSELRTAALALGARLYAEEGSKFSNRLGEYWKIWRNEKKRLRSR